MKWLNSLKNSFHGKGCEPYKSKEAKLAFAESLMKISDKLFFAPYVPLITLSFLDASSNVFFLQLIVAIFMFMGATWLRHEALLIIDEYNSEESD